MAARKSADRRARKASTASTVLGEVGGSLDIVRIIGHLTMHSSISARCIVLIAIQMAYNYDESMAILTVRLTADEERLLTKRSRGAGMKKATFVRQLIREEPFVTGADVIKDAERRMGDPRLRIARK
jgi:hypothetical protein